MHFNRFIKLNEIMIIPIAIVAANSSHASPPSILTVFPSFKTSASINDYLGNGIDLLSETESESLKDQCIEVSSTRYTRGEQNFRTYFESITQHSKLTHNINYDFSANASATYSRVIFAPTIDRKITETITSESSAVNIAAIVEFEYSTVAISERNLARSVFSNSRCLDSEGKFDQRAFERNFGNAFISKVKLGERFYIVFSSKFSTTTVVSRETVTSALKTKISQIFSLDCDQKQISEAERILQHTETKLFVGATGGFVPSLTADTHAAILQAYHDFREFVHEKINHQSATGPVEPRYSFSLLQAWTEPYETYLGNDHVSLLPITQRFDMLNHWRIFAKRCSYLQNCSQLDSVDGSTVSEAIRHAEHQANVCRDSSPMARYPGPLDYRDMIQQWITFAYQPIYRIQYHNGEFSPWEYYGKPVQSSYKPIRDIDLQPNNTSEIENSDLKCQKFIATHPVYEYVDGPFGNEITYPRPVGIRAFITNLPISHRLEYSVKAFKGNWSPASSDGALAGVDNTSSNYLLTGFSARIIRSEPDSQHILAFYVNGTEAPPYDPKTKHPPVRIPIHHDIFLGIAFISSNPNSYSMSPEIKISQTDSFGDPITTFSVTLSRTDYRSLKAGTFNLNATCKEAGIQLIPGQYYLICFQGALASFEQLAWVYLSLDQ